MVLPSSSSYTSSPTSAATRRIGSSRYKNTTTSTMNHHYENDTISTSSTSQSIVLRRCQSRIKQMEFELDVGKEVTNTLKSQLTDANLQIQKLQSALEGNGTIALGEKGLQELLSVSQNKLRQSEKDGAYTSERIQAMSKDLRKCRLRVQECELERALHLEKIDECLTMLSAQAGDDAKQNELQNKVLKLCKLKRDVESFQKKLIDRDARIKELKETEKISSAMVQELTRLLSPELTSKQIDETVLALQKGRELTTEQAQLLTIQHLKSQVEKLEDERSGFVHRITYLSDQLETASMVDSPNNNEPSKWVGFQNLLRTVSSRSTTVTPTTVTNNDIQKKYGKTNEKNWKKYDSF